jgi:hypothetical protein
MTRIIQVVGPRKSEDRSFVNFQRSKRRLTGTWTIVPPHLRNRQRVNVNVNGLGKQIAPSPKLITAVCVIIDSLSNCTIALHKQPAREAARVSKLMDMDMDMDMENLA